MTIIGGDDDARDYVWVPTALGIYGDLTDWKLVPEENASDWDVRRWRLSP